MTKREYVGHMADAQSRGDYWSSLNRREPRGMLNEIGVARRATLSADALRPVIEAGFGRRTR